MNIKRITYDALLSAMCVALGFFSISLMNDNMKITFENLPILIGALLFGPIDGALIGGIGIFLSQLLKYGIDVTTPLWIFPYVVAGWFVGFIAKRNNYNMKPIALGIVLLISHLLVTGLNTVGIIINNAFVRQIPEPVLQAIVPLPLKLLVCVIKTVAFTILIPLVIKGLEKAKLYKRPVSAGR